MTTAATLADRNLASAEAYYEAMKHNDPESMAKYLNENVRVVSPLGEVAGRERVLESAKGLMLHIMDMEIKARFASGDEVMLVYILECSQPIGTCPTAALMTFRDGLIVSNLLFFDPRPFEKLQQ